MQLLGKCAIGASDDSMFEDWLARSPPFDPAISYTKGRYSHKILEAAMISPDKVEAMIRSAMPAAATIDVQSGDGEHFEVTVVAAEFAGKRRVQQHQLVYGAVKEAMASDAIHAFALNTFTPEEWASKSA
jgi:acid stress-induced BolA-like protein IbaG/YrbA